MVKLAGWAGVGTAPGVVGTGAVVAAPVGLDGRMGRRRDGARCGWYGGGRAGVSLTGFRLTPE